MISGPSALPSSWGCPGGSGDLRRSRMSGLQWLLPANQAVVRRIYGPASEILSGLYRRRSFRRRGGEHAGSFGIDCPVLLDSRHDLSRLLGATITPEAVVTGPGGNVLYRGRIDDLYVTLGHRRYEARTHDLKDALDAVLGGRPISNPFTQAIGCSIST